MKKAILGMLGTMQEFFFMYHKSLTHIEGGLGSQILGMMRFYNNLEKYGHEKVKCDLSYFDNSKSDIHWPWKLGAFGINLEDLRIYESRKFTNVLKAKKDFIDHREIDQNYWLSCRKKYLSKFPYEDTLVKQFLIDIDITVHPETYGVIHIRRGDYLKVASKVIEMSQYLTFLSAIEKSIPNHLFFVSDSYMSVDEKNKISDLLGNARLIYFIDGPEFDSYSIHCFMRSAELLVTSNSTFSFSAGLLGKYEQVVFSPIEFHKGKGAEKYNKGFRSIGSFTSWDLDYPMDKI